MKKHLIIPLILGMTTLPATTVIACKSNDEPDSEKIFDISTLKMETVENEGDKNIIQASILARLNDQIPGDNKLMESDVAYTYKEATNGLDGTEKEPNGTSGMDGLVTIKIQDDNQNFKGELIVVIKAKSGKSWIDNNSIRNDSPYTGEITLTHTWSKAADTIQDITEIEDELQAILNQRNNQAWTQSELQNKVEEKYQDIIVSKVDINAFETSDHGDEWNFKGDNSIENDSPYTGEITLTHTWSKAADTIQDITEIEDELQAILNQRNNKAWTKDGLEQAIVNAEIDAEGGISVQNIINNEWRITGNGNDNNDFKYTGEITLERSFVADDITVYIDSNGQTRQTRDLNFDNIDATTIIKLGFNKDGKTITHFKGNKVPKVLPNEIKSLSRMFNKNPNAKIRGIQNWDVSNVTDISLMFCNASNFDQNINNWDVSNVTNMDSMFFGASNFNQNISGWNVNKVMNEILVIMQIRIEQLIKNQNSNKIFQKLQLIYKPF